VKNLLKAKIEELELQEAVLRTKILEKMIKDGLEKSRMSGVDGIMIGRGIFGKPWLFDSKRKKEPELRDRLKIMIEHTEIFLKEMGSRKRFEVMKKHYKAYVGGFDGAKDLRVSLMNASDLNEVKKIVKDFLKTYKK
jgi:tRNA-dihydrouridine synthase